MYITSRIIYNDVLGSNFNDKDRLASKGQRNENSSNISTANIKR